MSAERVSKGALPPRREGSAGFPGLKRRKGGSASCNFIEQDRTETGTDRKSQWKVIEKVPQKWIEPRWMQYIGNECLIYRGYNPQGVDITRADPDREKRMRENGKKGVYHDQIPRFTAGAEQLPRQMREITGGNGAESCGGLSLILPRNWSRMWKSSGEESRIVLSPKGDCRTARRTGQGRNRTGGAYGFG